MLKQPGPQQTSKQTFVCLADEPRWRVYTKDLHKGRRAGGRKGGGDVQGLTQQKKKMQQAARSASTVPTATGTAIAMAVVFTPEPLLGPAWVVATELGAGAGAEPPVGPTPCNITPSQVNKLTQTKSPTADLGLQL